MIRQLNTVDNYKVEVEGRKFSVIIFRIRNDVNGHPRYKAYITEFERNAAKVFTFTGHFNNEPVEAEYIVKKMLSRYKD